MYVNCNICACGDVMMKSLGEFFMDVIVLVCISLIFAVIITFCIQFAKYIKTKKSKDAKQWAEAVSLLWAQIFVGIPIFLIAAGLLLKFALGG